MQVVDPADIFKIIEIKSILCVRCIQTRNNYIKSPSSKTYPLIHSLSAVT